MGMQTLWARTVPYQFWHERVPEAGHIFFRASSGMAPKRRSDNALAPPHDVAPTFPSGRDMQKLIDDLRYALRMLARAPAVTLIAIASVGLGMGANLTIFSVANGFLSRTIHADRAAELVYVYRGDHSPLTFPHYRYLRDNATSLSGLIAERLMAVGVNIGAGDAERAQGAIVTNDYFSVLGVRPVAGGLFAARGDSLPATEPVVVLTHRYWQARFAGDPSVVGRVLRLNGQPFTVIGVAEEGFRSSQIMWRPDLFVPFGNARALIGVEPMRFGGSLYVTGRLARDRDIDAARAEMSKLATDLVRQDVQGNRGLTVRVEHARGITQEMRGAAQAMSLFLMCVVSIVLLIACANVANLLLARASDRQKEIAIRTALGATRSRLARMLLTESVLLSVLGGAAAVLLSLWSTRLIHTLLPADFPVGIDIAPNRMVLVYAAILSVLTGVLFGLAPALRSTSRNLAGAIKDEAAPRGFRRSRLRSAFVTAQVTLSLVLLIGATLFLRSLANARSIDPGFETRHVLDLRTDLALVQYDEARGRQFYQRLLERVRALPGVRAATYAELVPLEGSNKESTLWIKGRSQPDGERRDRAYFNSVGTEYFTTLGIPILRGRAITDADRPGAPEAIVVNETMARRFWPRENAVGQELSISGPEGPWHQVVGVARDTKYNTLGEAPPPFFYRSLLQNYQSERVLHARFEGDAAPVQRAIQAAARDLDAQLPPGEARLIEQDMSLALLPARAGAIVLGVFGALALALAVVGIYGVSSYAVAQRTREIGIRSALGAQQRELVGMVLREGMRLVVLGAALGIVFALVLWRLVASLLYDVSPADPFTFSAASILLLLVALLATWIPARRAARVDPMLALRSG